LDPSCRFFAPSVRLPPVGRHAYALLRPIASLFLARRVEVFSLLNLFQFFRLLAVSSSFPSPRSVFHILLSPGEVRVSRYFPDVSFLTPLANF